MKNYTAQSSEESLHQFSGSVYNHIHPMSCSRHSRILDYLHKVAIAVPKIGSGKLAAAIVYRGRIIAVGINQAKTHPLQEKFKKNPHRNSLHAEVSAIIRGSRILNEYELSRASIYVARSKKVNGIDSPGLAKPCAGCLDLIIASNIKEVWYTDEGGINRIGIH